MSESTPEIYGSYPPPHQMADYIAELEKQVAELREGIADARLCDTVVQMDEMLAALEATK